ncbi:hypothetical protein NEOLI_003846 [Neolecta irregularis DAH-3]|uniref:Glucose-induced degradation protein 4 n=1 Tax=Neolecta irregularis (strain DAH-3) TaxID=1198029 RepID=A0A1U7LMY3_NEOID|nr:hypothetical protein NEOLI_003846 [Neolecta irregularis DAH-3]|eukprot:OLL24026.1 hypothetical protein NEOLI_003846 [Neolecta irregularis DAH-3]
MASSRPVPIGRPATDAAAHRRIVALHAPLASGFRPRYISESAWLRPGTIFAGTQRLLIAGNLVHRSWPVRVAIESTSWDQMKVYGTMQASGVPNTEKKTGITTFWEGMAIIDFHKIPWKTGKWSASEQIDTLYWGKLPPFESIQVKTEDGVTYKKILVEEVCRTHILMRWKEIAFIQPSEEAGLTIAGFYYVSLRRDDGAIEAFYYDPASTPYQSLVLSPLKSQDGGLSFSEYSFR